MRAWSIVIPTLREAANLRELVPAVARCAAKAVPNVEILIVDDDSQDGTERLVGELAEQGLPVRLILRRGVRGLGSAVLEGFRQARFEVLFCMDADFSHPPDSLPRLAEALEEAGCDMAVGSRYVAGATIAEDWGFLRWLNSRVATLLARPFTAVRDPMSGLFALRRETFLAAEGLDPTGSKIGLELLVKCRCRQVREVPIPFANRKFGQSKLSLRTQLDYLIHLKRLADFRWGWKTQLAAFCAVGALGMAVDLSFYARLLAGRWPVPAARAAAILAATTGSFALNRRFVFTGGARARILPQFLRFGLVCAAGACLSWGLSVGLVHAGPWFGAHPLAAAIPGILAGSALNFGLSRQWAFRAPASLEASALPNPKTDHRRPA